MIRQFSTVRMLSVAIGRQLLCLKKTSTHDLGGVRTYLRRTQDRKICTSSIKHGGSRNPATNRFANTLKVTLDDTATDLNVAWLRENCRCSECYNAETFQRNVLFHHLDRSALTADKIMQVEETGQVLVTWGDGHESAYDGKWLRRNVNYRVSPGIKKYQWNAENVSTSGLINQVTFDSLVGRSNKAVELMAINLYRFGFAFVEKTPTNLEDTEKAACMVSTIYPTFYGPSWQFGNKKMDFKDTAYSNLALGAHTDGTYYDSPPGIQVFHCIVNDCTGGETLLVDGFHAAETLRTRNPTAFKVLTQKQISHRYLDNERNITNRDVILKVDPVTEEFRGIRYNPYDRVDFMTEPQAKVTEIYEALSALAEIIEDPTNVYMVKLKPGTILFVDNWRVLHGRTRISGTRDMCGCYLQRDDWQSKLRNLGLLP